MSGEQATRGPGSPMQVVVAQAQEGDAARPLNLAASTIPPARKLVSPASSLGSSGSAITPSAVSARPMTTPPAAAALGAAVGGNPNGTRLLNDLGLRLQYVYDDGNCGHRAIAGIVHADSRLHAGIRAQLAEYIALNKSQYEASLPVELGEGVTWEAALASIRTVHTRITDSEWHAARRLFKLRLVLISIHTGFPQVCFAGEEDDDSHYLMAGGVDAASIAALDADVHLVLCTPATAGHHVKCHGVLHRIPTVAGVKRTREEAAHVEDDASEVDDEEDDDAALQPPLLQTAVSRAAGAPASNGMLRSIPRYTTAHIQQCMAIVAQSENQAQALRAINSVPGFERVGRSTLQRWLNPSSQPAVMGRKVNAEFEREVLDTLMYNVLRDVKDPETFVAVANVPYPPAAVRAAAEEVQRRPKWQTNASVARLTFSIIWVKGFLRRNVLRRQRGESGETA